MSQSRPELNISNKRNNSPSLQTRLVLFVLFVALVPLIIIATRDILQTQQALTNGAEISLKSGATQTGAERQVRDVRARGEAGTWLSLKPKSISSAYRTDMMGR